MPASIIITVTVIIYGQDCLGNLFQMPLYPTFPLRRE